MNELVIPTKMPAASEVAGQSARQRAYEGLRAAILRGQFEPGTFIEEAVACAVTGVSRTPVREALSQLAAEGYLDLHRRRGAMLKTISADELFDLYEVRHMVESRAVRRICVEKRPIPVILHEICAAHDEIEEGDHLAFAELNRHFHEAIVAASGNKVLLQVFENLRANLTRVAMLSFRLGVQRTSEGTQHRRLVEALEAHDLDLALERVDIHLSRMPRLVASLSGSAQHGGQGG